MKYFFFLVFFTLLSALAFSQYDHDYKHKSLSSLNKKTGAKMKPKDHSLIGVKITEPEVIIQNKMPVLKFDVKEDYVGNNGKGLDIFLLKPGNIICLKPDASNIFNMPVVGLAAKEKY